MKAFIENFLNNIRNELVNNLFSFIVDAVIVTALLYILIAFLKKNNAIRLLKYILLFVFLSIILSSQALGTRMTRSIFAYSVILAVIFVVIVFPQEIRRALYKVASPKDVHENYNLHFACTDEELHKTIGDIVQAVLNMAKKNVGALIIIANDTVPAHILESGTELDSKISIQLVESIFNTKAPMHDGAVFIKGNRVMSAGCFLPLSQKLGIDKELGTRHRAALGVTEAYNVFAIIVSEETGVISTTYKGDIVRYYDSIMLTDALEQVYGLKTSVATSKKKRSKGR